MIAARQGWIDTARGIGVILVVYGHTLRGLVRAGVVPDGAVADGMDFTLYTFHMPLFFFLAGMNVPHSLARGRGSFLRNKLWTVAYPYLLWSLIQGGISVVLARDANIPIYPRDLAMIWFRPIAQFWFLYALMICHLLIVLVPDRRVLVGLAIAGSVAFQVLPARPDLALTLHHLPLYVVGILGGAAVTRWRPFGWGGVALVWVGFGVAVLFAEVWQDHDGWAAIPACVLGVWGVVAISKRLEEHGTGWLELVGRMSMTIYVMHILAASGVRMVMLRLGIPANPVLYVVVCTTAGVVAPMVAHVALQRARLLPWLGLGPWPRAEIKVAA